MNLVGKVIGNRYEILEKIGEGGMATVYKAKCNILKRYVAVKVLREEFTTDEEFIRRFNTEAQAAASLTHPNIVSIFDVGHEENIYYIVMELVQGKTLKEIINEDGVLPWKWSINIAIQVASALETAHKNNIVHRDIKPHNIIITEDGIAKVTDFGIAKAVSNSTITAFGTTIGSVHYFSPEHARGGYTDAKSDIYSLGVVMYEMLTGRVPFDADTPVSIALKHMQEKPIEPIVLNPAIPQSLNNLIMKAMQKDPNQRYSSATEMIEDLDRIIKNPEIGVSRVAEDTEPSKKEGTGTAKIAKEGKFAKFNRFLEEHKFVKAALIGIIFLIVFISTIAITLGVLNSKQPKDVALPNLVGLTFDKAKAKVAESKITVKIQEEKYDPEVPEGKIISQDPKYQENFAFTVKEGSTINVIISKGQELVKVTKLVGKTKDEARKELKELGLEMELEEEYSDEVEAGIIIEQDKQEGKASLGIEQVEVPDFKGLSEDEAKAKIAEAKLKWIRTDKIKDSSKGNGVVGQNISAKSMVSKNSEITITINEYQAMVHGTININVASLTGYEPTYKKIKEKIKDPETGEEKEVEKEVLANQPSKVKLVVLVDDVQVESKDVSEDLTNVTVGFDGEGTVRITVKIDGTVKARKDLNLNAQTTINIP